MALGLQRSCQPQEYFGEVTARHSIAEQNRKKKFMVFITGLLCLSFGLKSYLTLKAMLHNFPRERRGFVNESDICFVQFYSLQKNRHPISLRKK